MTEPIDYINADDSSNARIIVPDGQLDPETKAEINAIFERLVSQDPVMKRSGPLRAEVLAKEAERIAAIKTQMRAMEHEIKRVTKERLNPAKAEIRKLKYRINSLRSKLNSDTRLKLLQIQHQCTVRRRMLRTQAAMTYAKRQAIKSDNAFRLKYGITFL